MSWFKRHEEPQPKDEPEFPDVVAEKIAEMNRLQAAEHRYKRDGSHIRTNVVLQHKQSEIQRELLHEYDEVPIHDERTGKWRLFQGKS